MILKKLFKWLLKKVYGIEYDDIEDAYIIKNLRISGNFVKGFVNGNFHNKVLRFSCPGYDDINEYVVFDVTKEYYRNHPLNKELNDPDAALIPDINFESNFKYDEDHPLNKRLNDPDAALIPDIYCDEYPEKLN